MVVQKTDVNARPDLRVHDERPHRHCIRAAQWGLRLRHDLLAGGYVTEGCCDERLHATCSSPLVGPWSLRRPARLVGSVAGSGVGGCMRKVGIVIGIVTLILLLAVVVAN